MKAIVLIGGPAHGYKAVGPFEDRRAAVMWSALDSNAELEHCHVLDLEEPANDDPTLKWTVESETYEGWVRCQVWCETKESAERSLGHFKQTQPDKNYRLRQQRPGENIS